MQKILSNSSLAKNIQKARLHCGLTQEQVVEKMQLLGSPITRSTYSIIEMGRGNIFISDLVALQQIFSVNFDAFFADIPTER